MIHLSFLFSPSIILSQSSYSIGSSLLFGKTGAKNRKQAARKRLRSLKKSINSRSNSKRGFQRNPTSSLPPKYETDFRNPSGVVLENDGDIWYGPGAGKYFLRQQSRLQLIQKTMSLLGADNLAVGAQSKELLASQLPRLEGQDNKFINLVQTSDLGHDPKHLLSTLDSLSESPNSEKEMVSLLAALQIDEDNLLSQIQNPLEYDNFDQETHETLLKELPLTESNKPKLNKMAQLIHKKSSSLASPFQKLVHSILSDTQGLIAFGIPTQLPQLVKPPELVATTPWVFGGHEEIEPDDPLLNFHWIDYSTGISFNSIWGSQADLRHHPNSRFPAPNSIPVLGSKSSIPYPKGNRYVQVNPRQDDPMPLSRIESTSNGNQIHDWEEVEHVQVDPGQVDQVEHSVLQDNNQQDPDILQRLDGNLVTDNIPDLVQFNPDQLEKIQSMDNSVSVPEIAGEISPNPVSQVFSSQETTPEGLFKPSDQQLREYMEQQRINRNLVSMPLALLVVFLREENAQDIVAIDLKDKADFAEHMVIATGYSPKHLESIKNDIVSHVQHSYSSSIMSVEGEGTDGWITIDSGNFILHLMTDTVRQEFNIERLWTFKNKTDVWLYRGDIPLHHIIAE